MFNKLEDITFKITDEKLSNKCTNKDLVRMIRRKYQEDKKIKVKYLFENVFSIARISYTPNGTEIQEEKYYSIVGMVIDSNEILACQLKPILDTYIYIRNGPDKVTRYPRLPWDYGKVDYFSISTSELYNLKTGRPATKNEVMKIQMLTSLHER